jgi:hypothetical protein
VLQHYYTDDINITLSEAARCAGNSSNIVIQMLNKWVGRNIYNHARRGFTKSVPKFHVTYRSLSEMNCMWRTHFKKVSFEVDGFFSANAQWSGSEVLPPLYRFVVLLSYVLKSLCGFITPMKHLADSVYVLATNEKAR